MKTFSTMLKIESRLSIRDMNMVLFAILMPLVVLIILGVIYGGKSAFEGAEYTFIEQSFGALASIAICAGGLMGLPILVSDYRERKILKHMKVTPVSPQLILLVHLVIYSLYSLVSMISLWAVAGIFFGMELHGSLIGFIGSWLLVLISILSIGMLAGGVAKNSKQASVIASILYFPMLIFSGATLPYEVMPAMMQKIADIMPLTQGIKLMKSTFLGVTMEGVGLPIVIMIAIALVCAAAGVKFFRWE